MSSLANGSTPEERLDGMHIEIADWHAELKFLSVSQPIVCLLSYILLIGLYFLYLFTQTKRNWTWKSQTFDEALINSEWNNLFFLKKLQLWLIILSHFFKLALFEGLGNWWLKKLRLFNRSQAASYTYLHRRTSLFISTGCGFIIILGV